MLYVELKKKLIINTTDLNEIMLFVITIFCA
jgi:hypothetical protein